MTRLTAPRRLLKPFLTAATLLTLAAPAQALGLLDRGPIADFLTVFRQQGVPRQTIGWNSPYKPGTVVISTSQRRLYYILPNQEAVQYGVGVGREGFSWSGTKTVTMKKNGRPGARRSR